jgi:hypothetical protein
VLPAERRRFLATVGRRLTAQALERRDPQRRYPILLTLLAQSATDVLDEVVGLFDQAISAREGKAERKMRDALAERGKSRRGPPSPTRRSPEHHLRPGDRRRTDRRVDPGRTDRVAPPAIGTGAGRAPAPARPRAPGRSQPKHQSPRPAAQTGESPPSPGATVISVVFSAITTGTPIPQAQSVRRCGLPVISGWWPNVFSYEGSASGPDWGPGTAGVLKVDPFRVAVA